MHPRRQLPRGGAAARSFGGRLLAAASALRANRVTSVLLAILLHRRRRPPMSWRTLAIIVAISLLFTTASRLWGRFRSQAEASVPAATPLVPADAGAAYIYDKDKAPWEAKPAGAKLLVPRRIHHYFSGAAGIPARLVPELHSWARNHPDYQVYYWDAAHVERNLLTRPEYRQYHRYYWNGTASQYERDLIARLVILHQVGGISVQLDMRSLRDATAYLTDATCVVSQDRVEKAVFAYGLEALPSVALMACRPGHHFLGYFLRKVTEIEFRTGAVVLDAAAPTFVAHVFNAAAAAFDEACATDAGGEACEYRERVTLAEPNVFMPVMEPGLLDSLQAGCKSRHRLPFLQKEACYNLDVNGNEVAAESLAMPVYPEAGAPNKDQPLLPLAKIGLARLGGGGVGHWRPIKHWRWAGGTDEALTAS